MALRHGVLATLLVTCLAPCAAAADSGGGGERATMSPAPAAVTTEDRTAMAVTAVTLLRLDDLLFCNLAAQIAPSTEVDAPHRSARMTAAAAVVEPELKALAVRALATLPDDQLVAWVGIASGPHGPAFAASLLAFNRTLNRTVNAQGGHLLHDLRHAATAPAVPASPPKPGF